MPRQPFLPKHSKADLIFGIAHVAKKPKIAEAIGRCIMTWSYVDWQMAVLLAALMKANSEASVAIFLTLRNARAQRDVLIAAADTTLTPSNRTIFDAIISIYGSLQSQRADLAHGIFGSFSQEKDDETPWIETKNLSKEWIEQFHRPKPAEPTQQPDSKLPLKRSTYVYNVDGLERLESQIKELWHAAFAFTSYLMFPTLDSAEEALKKACTSPLMAQALKGGRKS